jgi:hypothetical protein
MTDDHLRRSLRAISTLGYGLALFLSVGGLSVLAVLFSRQGFSLRHAAVFLLIVFALFLAAVARSLRKFRPWARTASIVISFIGLLVVPLGTFLCGPFLYVLVKGKHLFMPGPPIQSTPPADIDRLAA